nr:RING-H2 finger protein ATL77-like [Parasteatoda tepidariorum]
MAMLDIKRNKIKCRECQIAAFKYAPDFFLITTAICAAPEFAYKPQCSQKLSSAVVKSKIIGIQTMETNRYFLRNRNHYNLRPRKKKRNPRVSNIVKRSRRNRKKCPAIRVTDLLTSRTDECPICLDIILAAQNSQLLTCGHSFHRTCITTWFRQNLSCPVCRQRPGITSLKVLFPFVKFSQTFALWLWHTVQRSLNRNT